MDEKKKLNKQKIIEMGMRKREKNKRSATNFRQSMKQRGIATALLRLHEKSMADAKSLARIRRLSLNEFLSRTIAMELNFFNVSRRSVREMKTDFSDEACVNNVEATLPLSHDND